MKKLRYVSLVLCFVLLINTSIPIAAASKINDFPFENVVIYENYAVYSYENPEYCFNIFLDSSNCIGSFAIIYSQNKNYMYDYSFSYSPNNADVTSATYWNDLINDCFSSSAKWNPIRLTESVSTAIVNQNTVTYSTTSDEFTDDFIAWLEEIYGPERTDSYVYSRAVRGVVFFQYETVEFSVIKNNTHLVLQAISVAGLITSVIGAIISPGLLATIGVFASATGLIPAGTRLNEYTLSAYWLKYITVKDGTTKHSYAEKRTNYTGYSSSELDAWSVNEEDAFVSYNPSSTLFESDDAQFTEAYNNYAS